MTETWTGRNVTTCHACGETLVERFFYAKTSPKCRHHGRWMILCPSCFHALGIGLGTAKGTEYEFKPTKFQPIRWERSS